MKLLRTGLISVIAAFSVNWADAQLQLLPGKETQCVLAGNARKIDLTWQNSGDQETNAQIRARIFQTTSATAVLVRESDWKKLDVLPRQEIFESARLDFPVVKAETKFLVQWFAGTNEIFGVTEVRVFPTNLLAELKLLGGRGPLGIFDPANELKPLLKNLAVEFIDLENYGLEKFSGQLAIVANAPATSADKNLVAQSKILAKKNIAVVWIRPPGTAEKLQPSFFTVIERTNAIVVAQPDLVSDLAENPRSQQNLISLCKLALNPNTPNLSDLSAQP